MVVIGSVQGQVMYQCRVLYIGSAPPIETLKGTEALQRPLRERYPVDMDDVRGIDAMLAVLPDALQLTYTESGQVVQFPLSNLTICAAMRAVNVVDGATGEKNRSFVPVNTIESDSSQPTIFSAIIRRSQGRQIAECHMFICDSTRDALHLVNTTATANMALKQSSKLNESRFSNGGSVRYVTSNNEGYQMTNGGMVNGDYEGDTIYIKTSATMEPAYHPPQPQQTITQTIINEPNHYQVQTPMPVSRPNPPIYVGFDKSHLIPKDDHTMMVAPAPPMPVAVPRMVMRPAPQPVMVPRPRYVIQRPMPPPPPRPVLMMRPRPVYYGPPPPIMRPMPVPMPMPMPMVRAPFPPPPSRMYARRVMSPPPRLYPQPVVVRSRPRSASPGYGTRSELRSRVSHTKYQPKWGGHSDIGDYRKSRIDNYEPPRDYMFLNERAFSRRINTDNRFSRDYPSQHYPTAYDMQGAMYYDRPTTKSNPRYSSSSDDEGDMRLSKSRR